MHPEEKDLGKDHSGHRKRKRKELLAKGAASMTDVDLLEMLLYYAVPRIDTRNIAVDMLEKFGSLAGVMDAGMKEITKFPGLKEGAEVLFSLLCELQERVGMPEKLPNLLDPEKLKQFLIHLFRDVEAETVYALYFDAEGILVGKQIVYRGGISAARFSLRVITEGAIRAGGCSVVLAHNHPSGALIPSNDDVISTRQIAIHLNANDIHLVEHYIVGEKDCLGILNI